MKRLRPTTEHTLESLRFFPLASWILVICFAFFVVHITIQLKNVTRDMALQSQQFEDEFTAPLKKATTTRQ